ncbi:MAG: hypothetical protein KGZ58_06540 [Ignavibacteriales bacterium]|nr:hypothetical protein [Ignavibacteriales bacterium]
MKKGLAFFLLSFFLIVGCKKKKDNITEPTEQADHYSGDTIDVVRYGVPKFILINYCELEKIHRISKFRSGFGHDYSDNFENCLSMKHYFEFHDSVDWASVKIFSPIAGTINNIYYEWAGAKLQITSKDHPAIYIEIFHIDTLRTFTIGDTVKAGEQLGTHVGNQTDSDIAIGVQTPNGRKLVSYFDVMSDGLFEQYQLRGVAHRNSCIISQQARNADTLKCNGERFLNSGQTPNWVVLN